MDCIGLVHRPALPALPLSNEVLIALSAKTCPGARLEASTLACSRWRAALQNEGRAAAMGKEPGLAGTKVQQRPSKYLISQCVCAPRGCIAFWPRLVLLPWERSKGLPALHRVLTLFASKLLNDKIHRRRAPRRPQQRCISAAPLASGHRVLPLQCLAQWVS